MYQRMFVYGTLLHDDILRKLIGVVPPSQPATLQGFRRMRMLDRPWPVIRPAPAAKVSGRILTGLKRGQLRQIDRYEGKEYKRKRVRVRLPDGRHCNAWAYVAAAGGGEPWSNESEQRHRRRWRAMLSGFRR